mmetsp:Transcript_27550/g.64987  ORF Transcript_27550/g.64987 Transcript_27550/m.64987 type:complete len:409 (-) Transcript_27550:72-1298(-)
MRAARPLVPLPLPLRPDVIARKAREKNLLLVLLLLLARSLLLLLLPRRRLQLALALALALLALLVLLRQDLGMDSRFHRRGCTSWEQFCQAAIDVVTPLELAPVLPQHLVLMLVPARRLLLLLLHLLQPLGLQLLRVWVRLVVLLVHPLVVLVRVTEPAETDRVLFLLALHLVCISSHLALGNPFVVAVREKPPVYVGDVEVVLFDVFVHDFAAVAVLDIGHVHVVWDHDVRRLRLRADQRGLRLAAHHTAVLFELLFPVKVNQLGGEVDVGAGDSVAGLQGLVQAQENLHALAAVTLGLGEHVLLELLHLQLLLAHVLDHVLQDATHTAPLRVVQKELVWYSRHATPLRLWCVLAQVQVHCVLQRRSHEAQRLRAVQVSSHLHKPILHQPLPRNLIARPMPVLIVVG